MVAALRAPPRRIISLQSRQSVDLGLDELLSGGQISLLPHVEERGLLFLQFRKGRVTVTAGKYVGLIPITADIALDVMPKMPVGNIARVLDGARAHIQALPGTERVYSSVPQESESVLKFLLSNLLDALEPIRRAGLLKRYHRETEIASHPRGRIQLARTLQSCWSKGVRHRVAIEKFSLTADVPENRVLKAALVHVLQGLRRAGIHGDILASANAAYNELPSQIGFLQPFDRQRCADAVSMMTLPGGRDYYYRALEIALLITSARSLKLEGVGTELTLDACIIDFESVFEAYLRHVLQSHAPSDIAVRDGNRDGKKPLYDDRNDPPAQPDIVLTSRTTCRSLIAEVKYKDKPDRSDINQAVTYALTYRTPFAVLLHQAGEGKASGLRHIGSINGIEVKSYGFQLSRSDLEVEESMLSERLCALLMP